MHGNDQTYDQLTGTPKDHKRGSLHAQWWNRSGCLTYDPTWPDPTGSWVFWSSICMVNSTNDVCQIQKRHDVTRNRNRSLTRWPWDRRFYICYTWNECLQSADLRRLCHLRMTDDWLAILAIQLIFATYNWSTNSNPNSCLVLYMPEAYVMCMMAWNVAHNRRSKGLVVEIQAAQPTEKNHKEYIGQCKEAGISRWQAVICK